MTIRGKISHGTCTELNEVFEMTNNLDSQIRLYPNACRYKHMGTCCWARIRFQCVVEMPLMASLPLFIGSSLLILMCSRGAWRLSLVPRLLAQVLCRMPFPLLLRNPHRLQASPLHSDLFLRRLRPHPL